MTEQPDVTFEIEFGDGIYVQVNQRMINSMQQIVEEELLLLLARVADRLAWSLRDKYQELIRERPRAAGRSLRDRVLQAITTGIESRIGVVQIGVFNLGSITRSTRNEGAGDRSLFEIMEEGYDTAEPYGFVPLEAARELARACADEYELKDDKRLEFLAYVEEHFKGRHGEGIMTNVFAPLFYHFPDFGTAFEHGFLPHGGWQGWNVLSQADGPLMAKAAADSGQGGGGNWILALLEQAFANAGRRLKAMAG